MKKIILAVLLVAATLSAKAWSTNYDKAVLLVASQSYSPETHNLVTEYVGKDHTRPSNHLAWHRRNGRHLETEGWHTLHLDQHLKHAAKDENDALVQIDKALEVIRNRELYDKSKVSFAIQTVMNLVIDMHNLSNVVIEDIPKSGTDFQLDISQCSVANRPIKWFKYSWKKLWTYRYQTFHGNSVYSPQMWSEDIVCMYGDKKAEFSAGTLQDWATDIGTYTKGVYDRLEKEEGRFIHKTVQEHEALHMACLARAAYRIAVLLNSNLK